MTECSVVIRLKNNVGRSIARSLSGVTVRGDGIPVAVLSVNSHGFVRLSVVHTACHGRRGGGSSQNLRTTRDVSTETAGRWVIIQPVGCGIGRLGIGYE
jgi:hypothetical protein